MNAKTKLSAFSFAMIIGVFFLMPSKIFSQQQAIVHPETNQKNVQKERTFSMIPGLTEEQKTKIKNLMFENQKSAQLLRAQTAEKAAHLRTLTLADTPDRKAIDKTIDEITSLRGDLMKQRIDLKFALKNTLTPDQFKAWEMRHQWTNHRKASGMRQENWNNGNFGMRPNLNRPFSNRNQAPGVTPEPDQNK